MFHVKHQPILSQAHNNAKVNVSNAQKLFHMKHCKLKSLLV